MKLRSLYATPVLVRCSTLRISGEASLFVTENRPGTRNWRRLLGNAIRIGIQLQARIRPPTERMAATKPGTSISLCYTLDRSGGLHGGQYIPV